MNKKIVRGISFLAILALIGVGGYFTIKALPTAAPAARSGAEQPAIERDAAAVEAEAIPQDVLESIPPVELDVALPDDRALEVAAMRAKILAAWASSPDVSTIDLGSGYELAKTAGGYALVERAALPPVSGPAVTRIDLGSGYEMVLTAAGWEVQEPFLANISPAALRPNARLTDADIAGRVLAASRFARDYIPAAASRVDIGSGYTLVNAWNGWNILDATGHYVFKPPSGQGATRNEGDAFFGPSLVNSILGWEAVNPNLGVRPASEQDVELTIVIGGGCVLSCDHGDCEMICETP